MKETHDTWAHYYDFVYQKTYGDYFNVFTKNCLSFIKSIISSGIIIDYGAGTGRLSIPLINAGYELIAVEKSKGMTDVMLIKLKENNCEIPVFNQKIYQYTGPKADLALAMFTVLNYTIEEKEFEANMINIVNYLNKGGYFFFDLPNQNFINQNCIVEVEDKDFYRKLSVKNAQIADIYELTEECRGIMDGKPFSFIDKYKLKYYSPVYIDKLLSENGMQKIEIDISIFENTGSTYLLYRKIL